MSQSNTNNNEDRNRIQVLVVGQTPPPFGGQAIMIGKFVDAQYDRLQLHHVRMAFSREMDEIGRFGWGKVLHLFAVIFRIWGVRLTKRIDVLYFPPAGPNRTPVLRDIVILLSTRWLFKRVVFHFHAGGVTEFLPSLPAPIRFLARLAYRRPTTAIALSPLSPPDGERLGAKQIAVVPNGVDDDFPAYAAARAARSEDPPHILFVGVMMESKGAMVLLEACARLHDRGVRFHLDMVGKSGSPEFLQQAETFIASRGLKSNVTLQGVKTGADKWRLYASSSIFAFPSHFEAENLPVVVVEAMQFALPVVATDWRGIATLVDEGRTGYLAPARDPAAVADRLAELIADAAMRQRLGQAGREKFLQKYTLARWQRAMEQTIVDAVAPEKPAWSIQQAGFTTPTDSIQSRTTS